jgi:hypothetical protein
MAASISLRFVLGTEACPDFVFLVETSPVSLGVSELPESDLGYCEEAGVDSGCCDDALCCDDSVGAGAPLVTGVIESLNESR